MSLWQSAWAGLRTVGGVAAPAARSLVRGLLPGVLVSVADKVTAKVSERIVSREVAKMAEKASPVDELSVWFHAAPPSGVVLVAVIAIVAPMVAGLFQRKAAAVAPAPVSAAAEVMG